MKTRDEGNTLERAIFRLHGELMMGPNGSDLVELAASMGDRDDPVGAVSRWPRSAKGLGGVLYPRIGQGAKRFWRDLHAVVGMWVSVFALFLLVSGLPWATVWGSAFKSVRAMTGTAAVTQDWKLAGDSAHAEHMDHDMGGMAGMEHMSHGVSLDTIITNATAQNLAPPVLITPPSKKDPNWWAKSDAQNRPARADVALSAMTGEVLARKTFGESTSSTRSSASASPRMRGNCSRSQPGARRPHGARPGHALRQRFRDVATPRAGRRSGVAAAYSGCKDWLGPRRADRRERRSFTGARHQSGRDRSGRVDRPAPAAVRATLAGSEPG